MVRYLASILVVVFYLMAYYQEPIFQGHKAKASVSVENGIILRQAQQAQDDTIPLYHENFINKEAEGKISHVSSVAPIGTGRMGSVWYSGAKELAFDVAIFFSVYDENTGKWDEPIKLIDKETASKELNRFVRKLGNPLLFRDQKGNIWLFYSALIANGWSGSTIAYKVSNDEGQTWSASKKMLLSPFFNFSNNVKNKGINLPNDTFLLPVYHEFINKYPQLVSVNISDEGIKYDIRKITAERDMIQPSLIFENGESGESGEKEESIISFFRNSAKAENRFILSAKSRDMGKSWGETTKTPLPNPNSGFDVIRLKNGDYIAVINNSFKDRGNLSLVISYDKGRSWKVLRVIENYPDREYSYPSIIQSLNGRYHVTYTYEKKQIKHIVFNDAWLHNIEKGFDERVL